MWFYISKEEVRYSPTSSSAFLFCSASIEYRHEWTDTVKNSCASLSRPDVSKQQIIITSNNTESVILDSYEFASAQQGLLTGILYHRNKLIPLLKTLSRVYFYLLVRILIYMRKRSPCCMASSDVFFPLLRFIFHSDDEQYLHLYLRYDWYLHPSAWYGR